MFDGDDAPDARHFVAGIDGVVRGVASLVVESHPPVVGEHQFRVRGMAVSARHRGRGTGRRLLDACVGDAKERGADGVWRNASLAARTLYSAAGFEPLRRHSTIQRTAPMSPWHGPLRGPPGADDAKRRRSRGASSNDPEPSEALGMPRPGEITLRSRPRGCVGNVLDCASSRTAHRCRSTASCHNQYPSNTVMHRTSSACAPSYGAMPEGFPGFPCCLRFSAPWWAVPPHGIERPWRRSAGLSHSRPKCET